MTPGEALRLNHVQKCLPVMTYAVHGDQTAYAIRYEYDFLCSQESEVQLPPPPPLEGRPWTQDPPPERDPHGWGQEGKGLGIIVGSLTVPSL